MPQSVLHDVGESSFPQDDEVELSGIIEGTWQY